MADKKDTKKDAKDTSSPASSLTPRPLKKEHPTTKGRGILLGTLLFFAIVFALTSLADSCNKKKAKKEGGAEDKIIAPTNTTMYTLQEMRQRLLDKGYVESKILLTNHEYSDVTINLEDNMDFYLLTDDNILVKRSDGSEFALQTKQHIDLEEVDVLGNTVANKKLYPKLQYKEQLSGTLYLFTKR